MYKENPEILDTLTNSFVNSLKEYKYKTDDPENVLILKPNGDRLDNPAGWPETLDSLVAQKATKYFTFLKQKPKGGAGNEGGDGKDGKEVKATPEFKTVSEYNTYMKSLDTTTPEGQKKQIEGLNKYKELVKKGELTE